MVENYKDYINSYIKEFNEKAKKVNDLAKVGTCEHDPETLLLKIDAVKDFIVIAMQLAAAVGAMDNMWNPKCESESKIYEDMYSAILDWQAQAVFYLRYVLRCYRNKNIYVNPCIFDYFIEHEIKIINEED